MKTQLNMIKIVLLMNQVQKLITKSSFKIFLSLFISLSTKIHLSFKIFVKLFLFQC